MTPQMVDPVLSIAAALSVQSPFTSRAHRDLDAMVCTYEMICFTPHEREHNPDSQRGRIYSVQLMLYKT